MKQLPACTHLHTQTIKLQPNVQTISLTIDIFWKEFKDFANRTDPYSYQSGLFENDDVLSGRSHAQYEMQSLRFTQVLGFVACQTTFKQLGIGSVEWSWSDDKMIKNGKQLNLGGSSLEKRAIPYTSAKLENVCVLRSYPNNNHNFDVFGDDYIKSALISWCCNGF